MYSSENLLPIRLKTTGDGILISSSGAELEFKGTVLQVDDCGCDNDLLDNDSNLLILTGSYTSDVGKTIRNVEWFDGKWSRHTEMLVSSTDLQDNILFFRVGGISFFLSLDFPCSTISDGCVSYRPDEKIAADGTYFVESLSIGAVKLTGFMVGQYDRAEIEGVSEYIEKRFPSNFNRPVNSITCITNQMTDVREGRIFYSMHNNPTLYLDPETIKKEIRTCAELGIEYYQLFEGKFDWPDEVTCDRTLKEIVSLGKELGVRVGDYVHPGELFCPHYNYEHRVVDKPQWRRLNTDGTRSELCFGNDEYVDYISRDLVAHNRKYGEEMICLDMLSVLPCQDEGHGHGPGGLFKQMKGLCRFTKALSDISPDYLIWTNSGNWIQFMPKLLWYNPNVYLSDPHPRENGPTLNMLKFYDDARREQMVSVHNKYFVPYRYYTNCEYYLSRHSRVNDLNFFEYGILQGLAVNPNLCIGELRVFLESVPHNRYEDCKRFLRKWIGFIKTHFDCWKHTFQVGDSPGVKSNEIYAHISVDKGFVCFVNQDIYAKQSTIHLDQRIGLATGERFVLNELYPHECPCAEGALPYSSYGDAITFAIPPLSVRYIEIAPYEPAPERLQVSGLPSAVEATADGFTITLRASQGEVHDIGLVFPVGQGMSDFSIESSATVKMYTFPAQCELLECHGNLTHLNVQFPRDHVVSELSFWSVDGEPACHLPTNTSRFLGSYVHNLFSEEYQVVLTVKTKGQILSKEREIVTSEPAPLIPTSVAEGGVHTYETSFYLPFIEWPAMSMAYGWDEIIEFAFVDASQVKSISCHVNGQVVDVCRYKYPANPKLCNFYIELMHVVQSGIHVEIRLEIEWFE